MDLLHRIELWGSKHHPKWVDIFRIALGIFLIIRGIQFPQQMEVVLRKLPFMSFGSFSLIMLEHYIIFAHLVGGFLLVVGVLTRFACLVQIPILLGAIFFVNSSYGDLWHPFSELYISVLVFFMLIYFLIVGNGGFSLYKYFAEE